MDSILKAVAPPHWVRPCWHQWHQHSDRPKAWYKKSESERPKLAGSCFDFNEAWWLERHGLSRSLLRDSPVRLSFPPRLWFWFLVWSLLRFCGEVCLRGVGPRKPRAAHQSVSFLDHVPQLRLVENVILYDSIIYRLHCQWPHPCEPVMSLLFKWQHAGPRTRTPSIFYWWSEVGYQVLARGITWTTNPPCHTIPLRNDWHLILVECRMLVNICIASSAKLHDCILIIN